MKLCKIIGIDGLFAAVLAREICGSRSLYRRSIKNLDGKSIIDMLKSGYCCVYEDRVLPFIGYSL